MIRFWYNMSQIWVWSLEQNFMTLRKLLNHRLTSWDFQLLGSLLAQSHGADVGRDRLTHFYFHQFVLYWGDLGVNSGRMWPFIVT